MSLDDPANLRGKDPAQPMGPWAPPPTQQEPNPNFQPDPNLAQQAFDQFLELSNRERPRRENVLPYLLIRAYSPGDRGVRPTWPPTACWESPDLLLIDASYTGPFDPSRLVGSPVAGRSYRVFVRVFNLGLVPAVGTHLQAWYVDPGFFSGQPGHDPHPIGGAFVDLDDRTRPGAQQVVEVDVPWVIPPTLTGHECLVASVSCVVDPWSGVFDANKERHLGQRNLEIAVGSPDIGHLIGILGTQVPVGGALEVIHAGAAVVPLLQATVGGHLVGEDGMERQVVAPDPAELRHGVAGVGGLHLLTAVAQDTRSLVVASDVLSRAAPPGRPAGPSPRTAAADGGAQVGGIFEQPDGPARVLSGLDDRVLAGLATIGAANALGEVLPAAFARLLDVGDLRAATVANALGGPSGAAHLLRFVLSDKGGALVGGYSVVVAA